MNSSCSVALPEVITPTSPRRFAFFMPPSRLYSMYGTSRSSGTGSGRSAGDGVEYRMIARESLRGSVLLWGWKWTDFLRWEMSYLPLLGRFVGIRSSFLENAGWLGVRGGEGSQRGATDCFLRSVRQIFLRRSAKAGFRRSSLVWK